MKKSKLLIVLFIVIISFCFGISEIKALPECDLSFYNASVEAKESSGDATCGDNELCAKYCPKGSLLCFDTGRTDWTSGQRQAAVSINANDNNTITSWSMTIYESHNDGSTPAACTLSQSIDNESPGKDIAVYVNFGENKKDSNGKWVYGHIYTVHFGGTYKDANGQTHSFESDHVTLSKEGQFYTTNRTPKTTTKAGQTTTALKVDPVDGESFHSGGGAVKQTADDSVSTDTACSSISALFDEFWPYVMVIIPILLIIMISIDFFKAVASGDADTLKKSGTNTVKRTITAVILLILPVLLDTVFGLFGIDICL